MNNKTTFLNISRHGQSNGWQVRVQRSGVMRTKMLTDQRYVSAAGSLAMAMVLRDHYRAMPLSRFVSNRSY
jgi:hypothetical protein